MTMRGSSIPGPIVSGGWGRPTRPPALLFPGASQTLPQASRGMMCAHVVTVNMRSSAERALSPTHCLKGLSLPELIARLASLFPAGRHAAADLRGRDLPVDVFVTFERRAARSIRVVARGVTFVLDDGADEFSRIRLAGAPTFDP